MTTETLAELRRLLEKATPLPWKRTTDGEINDVRVCQVDDEGCVCCLALMGNVEDDGQWDADTVERWNTDAALIVALRDNADALLDAAEAAPRWRSVAEVTP